MTFSSVACFLFLTSIFFIFHNKLLSLLMLECVMLFLVADFCFSLHSGISGSMVSFILMIFLVLDSVFGLSLLGNSTRLSSFFSPFRFEF